MATSPCEGRAVDLSYTVRHAAADVTSLYLVLIDQVTAVEHNYLSLEQPYSTDLRLQCFDCHFESYHLHHHSRRLAVPDVTRDMGECKQ